MKLSSLKYTLAAGLMLGDPGISGEQEEVPGKAFSGVVRRVGSGAGGKLEDVSPVIVGPGVGPVKLAWGSFGVEK